MSALAHGGTSGSAESSEQDTDVRLAPEGEERFYAWRVSANRWELRRVAGIWRIDRRTNRLMNGDPDARALLDDIDGPIATETRDQQ